jgi:hypothetical protein
MPVRRRARASAAQHAKPTISRLVAVGSGTAGVERLGNPLAGFAPMMSVSCMIEVAVKVPAVRYSTIHYFSYLDNYSGRQNGTGSEQICVF